MNPIIYVLFATLALGIAESSSNQVLKRYEKITSVGLILMGNIISFFLTLGWMLIFGIPFTPISWFSLLMIALIVCVYYFANNLYYTSYKTEEASTVSVLMMASIIVSTIFGQIVFQEQITAYQWIGIVLVVLAIIRINVGKFSASNIKEVFSFSKAKLMALGGAALYGLGFSFSKFMVQDIDPHYFQFLDIIVGLPLYFMLDSKKIISQAKVLFSGNLWMKFIPIILFYFTYNKLKYMAFSAGIALPVADSVDNMVIFVILAMEFFVFKVKQDNYLEKLIIALVALAGVILISL